MPYVVCAILPLIITTWLPKCKLTKDKLHKQIYLHKKYYFYVTQAIDIV